MVKSTITIPAEVTVQGEYMLFTSTIPVSMSDSTWDILDKICTELKLPDTTEIVSIRFGVEQ